MSKSPITVYFSDNQSADIYRLTADQLQVFFDADDWDGAQKFKVLVEPVIAGYAPDWLITLSEVMGFEVDSI